MALPPGITTKTLTVSPATSVGKVRSSLEILIEPTKDVVVWQPTAEPVSNFFKLIRTTPDEAAVIRLPAVDQVGFVDDNGDPMSDWAYKITVRYLRDGRKVGQTLTKYFKPLLSSPNVQDFDIIPTGESPLYQGPEGPQGLSAYDVAVKNGFVGTEVEWLASLATGGYVPSYTHYQMEPSDTWTIHHNLGYHPGGVTVTSSANQRVQTEVQYVDTNTIRVVMSGAMSGTAYIS